MARAKDKWPANVPGKFYVDDQCIACDACIREAPGHFVMNDEDSHAFVVKQPKTPAELAACLEALEACPVEAIGQDGEDV
jgi:ferredoxin